MSKALKMVSKFLDSKGFHYQADEKGNSIRTGVGGLDNKGNIDIKVYFDDNDRTMGVRSYSYCAFPENKKAMMYEICSQMNSQYRWVKFYVDEKDNTVTLSEDAIISLDSGGDETLELIMRLANIADEAYPNFMKAIWQ